MIRPGDRKNPQSRDDPASPTRRPCPRGATGPRADRAGPAIVPTKNSQTRSPCPGSTLPIGSTRRATDRVDSPAGHPLYRVSSPREGDVGPAVSDGPEGRRIRRTPRSRTRTPSAQSDPRRAQPARPAPASSVPDREEDGPVQRPPPGRTSTQGWCGRGGGNTRRFKDDPVPRPRIAPTPRPIPRTPGRRDRPGRTRARRGVAAPWGPRPDDLRPAPLTPRRRTAASSRSRADRRRPAASTTASPRPAAATSAGSCRSWRTSA